jgi:hypothetical protein
MRITIDGMNLETAAYAEGEGISFTFFSDDDDWGLALSEALADQTRVHELLRGGEELSVRVRQHEVSPPYSRRFGGAIHRHSVELEQVGANVVPFPLPAQKYNVVAAR